MRITRLVREFLTSSTAIVTASIVAATVSSGTVSAKRAQTPSPLFPCNGGLETRSGKREDEHFEAEIPFEKLFKAGLNIPYSDLLVMDQIAFTRGGYDAVRLWDGSDAEALNAMNKEERHNYFTRLLNESKIGATYGIKTDISTILKSALKRRIQCTKACIVAPMRPRTLLA